MLITQPPNDFQMITIILKTSGKEIRIGGKLSEIELLENCMNSNLKTSVNINGHTIKAEEVAAVLKK